LSGRHLVKVVPSEYSAERKECGIKRCIPGFRCPCSRSWRRRGGRRQRSRDKKRGHEILPSLVD
jgi:hypothetical protein